MVAAATAATMKALADAAIPRLIQVSAPTQKAAANATALAVTMAVAKTV